MLRPAVRRRRFGLHPRLEGLESRQLLATFTVTNIEDAGAGSLRQAILDANVNPGADVIAFDIPGDGPHTIRPTSELPMVTDALTIDGYSQPGSRPNSLAVGGDAVLLIELDGSGYTQPDVLDPLARGGLRIEAPDSTVRGLAINRFEHSGLFWTGDRGRLEGNYLGTDPTGTVPLGNGRSGIDVNDASITIGGTTPEARNVISGNGIGVLVLTGREVLVAGNYVGTDASGSVALGGGTGISVALSTSSTTIGGTTPEARNVISGHLGAGVDFFGAGESIVQGNIIGLDAGGSVALGNGAGVILGLIFSDVTIGGSEVGAGNTISGNRGHGVIIRLYSLSIEPVVVAGNRIGTDPAGSELLGNGGSGVAIEVIQPELFEGISPRTESTIGGTEPGAGNLIVGNRGDGILLESLTIGTVVQGNQIGTDGEGRTGFGNLGAGVRISSSAGNTIGGTEPGAGNVIARNGAGVVIEGPESVGNSILTNSIFDNEGPNIRIEGPEVPAPPTLVSTTIVSTGMAPLTTVETSFSGLPMTRYRIEYFASEGPEAEGQTFLTSLDLLTDSAGQAFASAAISTLPPGQTVFTATATGPDGSTSEFSAPLRLGSRLPLVADLSLRLTAAPEVVQIGQPLTYTVVLTNNGPDFEPEVRFNALLFGGAEVVSVTTPRGEVVLPTLTPDALRVDVRIVNLAPGESVPITITALPLRSGPLEFRADAFGRALDPDGTASIGLVTPASPEQVVPRAIGVRRLGFHAQPTRLVLAFNRPLEPTRAENLNNYRLFQVALEQTVGRPEGFRVPLRSARYDPLANTVTLTTAQPLPLRPVRFQLVVDGTSPGGLRGVDGLPIDGDGDGQPGGDFVAPFGGEILVLPPRIARIINGPDGRRRLPGPNVAGAGIS
ncbi:hypothetical protein BH23PLA1_BH23PLA1_19060 [soil metagenome]